MGVHACLGLFLPLHITFLSSAAMSPMNVMATQTGPTTVLVSWTPTSHNYRITVNDSRNSTVDVGASSSWNLTFNSIGIYRIKVLSLSISLLPGEGGVTVIVNGPGEIIA